MWGKGNPSALLVGMQIGTASMENNIEGPEKIKNRATVWSSNSASGYISKGNEISVSKRYLHSHVLCIIFDNSQDTETNKCLLTNKDVNTHTHTHKHTHNPATCHNMGIRWRPCSKWNKSNKGAQVLHDLTYMWNLKKRKKTPPELKDTENRLVIAEGQGVGGGIDW